MQCQACGRSFWAARSDARSCGPGCKKRLQRGSTKRICGRETAPRVNAGSVPFIAAGKKGTKPGTPTPAEFRANYSHGHMVTFIAGPGGWRPGRINWHSQAGEECMTDMERSPWEDWMLPIEDLTGCTAVYAFDVHLA